MTFADEDIAYALSCYKTLAWPMGVWPIEDDTYSKIRCSFAIISQISLATTLALEVYLACENSAEDPVDTYVVGASALLVIIKLSLLRIWRSSLATNISSAMRDWRCVEDSSLRDVMLRYARTAKTISLSFFFFGSFTIMLYMLRFFIFLITTSDARMFYLPTSCLFESVSNVQYVLVIFYQIIQLFITCFGNCCTEGIFVGVTLHLCGQFELLMTDFRRIDRCKHTSKRGSIVKKLVIKHRRLIRLTETIEESYNFIILTQILTSTLLICIAGFAFIESLNLNEKIMTAKNITAMIVMLLQPFLYSYAGGHLKEQSEALSFAVYDSNWCNFLPNDVKDLAFILVKTNIPIYITAGKFFYVTRATFMDILKTAISYLSTLRVMMQN